MLYADWDESAWDTGLQWEDAKSEGSSPTINNTNVQLAPVHAVDLLNLDATY